MKKLTALLILVIAFTLVALPAQAKMIKGRGTLTASGTGVARIVGGGEVQITGSGFLHIEKVSNDVNVTVDGQGRKREHGKAACYAGFQGKVTISGSHFVISLAGRVENLTATGKGKVFLRGRGVYQVGDETGRWTPRGTLIHLGE